jgi:hypothetical protein
MTEEAPDKVPLDKVPLDKVPLDKVPLDKVSLDKVPLEKMNIVDNASLTFFTNPHYLSILQRKKLEQMKDNTAEIKFYRKRIIALFKDMLKEEGNKEIKEIHTAFVNMAIRYFEITDKKDIIQGQHTQEPQHMQDPQHTQETLTPEELLDTFGGSDTLDEANDKMMRKTVALANLDNYVITKSENTADLRIIPMKMDIDLKTQDLKIKGVPPKKIKKL